MKPRESHLKKYCNPKKSQSLELEQIQLFGRQILEVNTTPPCDRPEPSARRCSCLSVCVQSLKLLHDSGLFFGHLHASNVMVDDGVCRLVDVENGILGVPSVLRPAFTQLRKINVCENDLLPHLWGPFLFPLNFMFGI